MKDENNRYRPREQSLKAFRDNVAHSNNEHGIKTYPGGGYWPKEETAIFKDCLSFRNGGSGVFLHNSGNIKIEGGLFSDNRVQINFDRAPICGVDNAKIVGYSDEFRFIREATKSRGHCPSAFPLRGIEMHSYYTGGYQNGGQSITNIVFDKFGDTGCDSSVPIMVDEEDLGYFDVLSQVENLSFADTNLNPFDNCNSSYSGLDKLVLRDEDGSIMGQPGYILSDLPALTTFANCFSDTDSCTAHCPGECLRTYVLAVSTIEAEEQTLELEITDNTSNKVITIESSYIMPVHDDGSIDIAQHTRSHRNNLYFAVLPSGGDYSARFRKGGGEHWPLYVRADYDDPGSTCPEFNLFAVVEPELDHTVTCQELIRNGDIELGIEGWLATMGGLEIRDENSSGQGLALTNMYRTSFWMGPAQFFDTRCLVFGARYSVTYKAKLISRSDGSPVDCDALDDKCPKLIGKLESGAHKEREKHWMILASFPTDSVWVADGWNTVSGAMVVNQRMADAGSTETYFECKTLYTSDGSQVLMVIDDVSVRLEYWPSDNDNSDDYTLAPTPEGSARPTVDFFNPAYDDPTYGDPTLNPTSSQVPSYSPAYNGDATISPTPDRNLQHDPTFSPTSSQVPTFSPTASSTSHPTVNPTPASTICADDITFRHKDKEKRTCKWVGKQMDKGKTSICKNRKVKEACILTCGKCTLPCIDDPDFYHKKNEKKTCKWVSKKKKKDRKKLCKNRKINAACRLTCEVCDPSP